MIVKMTANVGMFVNVTVSNVNLFDDKSHPIDVFVIKISAFKSIKGVKMNR